MNPQHRFHPVFQSKLNMIIGELRGLGWRPKVDAHAFRTPEEQANIVRAGNSWTKNSWHVPSTQAFLPHGPGAIDVVSGNAADIVDERYGWSGPAANPHFRFWLDLGRVAKKYGCEWGGDWKRHRDVAHVQLLMVEGAPRSTVAV